MEQQSVSLLTDTFVRRPFESTLDAAGIGCWELDCSAGVIAASIVHDRIFGYDAARGDWTIAQWYEHIVYNDRDEFAAQLATAKLIGTLNTECRIQRRDGNVRWIAITGALRMDASRHRYLTGIIVDITDTRRREQEPYLAAPALNTDFADSVFITKMSHAIRTPLHAIQGFNFLLQKTSLNFAQNEYVDKIDNAAQTLLSTLNAIADYSKIEMGALKIETVDFQLDRILDHVSQVLEAECDAKGLHYSVLIAPDVPMQLRGDPRRLQQILLSLGRYAIAVAHRGEIVVSVLLLPDENANENAASVPLYFSVRDTGLGLNSAQTLHVFDVFERAETPSGRARIGVDVEVAVSKRLIEVMGGTLTLNSVLGRGSEFNFNLTLQHSGGEAQSTPVTALASMEKKAVADINVLLVDDDNLNLQVGRAILNYLGIEHIDTASNGLEAVDLVEQYGGGHYQLILMDLQMPVMDGYVASREIRRCADAENITIVAMTADISTDSEKCFIAGMNEFLTKPINIPQLTEIMSRRIGVTMPSI